MDTASLAADCAPVHVERWPSELPLLALVIVASAGLWSLFVVSIFGIVYAVLLGLFFFVTHLAFVGHVRGSAVRIGPEQFPELHARVLELSRRAGLRTPPEAYVMQAGGSLNALATKFLRARMIVLFSDLLDACGEDAAARDMFIGHELGHIRAGHLSWFWLIVPGMFVPFLGAAYSRARERTCDRYGAALCQDRRGAVKGLTLLAAGGARSAAVNARAFVRQREDLDTGWMTLARWLSGYPALCERVAAVDPTLDAPVFSTRGPVRALGILALLLALPVTGAALVVLKVAPAFSSAMQQAQQEQVVLRPAPRGDDAQLRARVFADFDRLAEVVAAIQGERGALPPDANAIYEAWPALRPGVPAPMDPADGARYGYDRRPLGYALWSSGSDGVEGTDDDLVANVSTQAPADLGRAGR